MDEDWNKARNSLLAAQENATSKDMEHQEFCRTKEHEMNTLMDQRNPAQLK